MDDRSLIRKLLQIGVSARQKNADAYAMLSDDSTLKELSSATIANWLEKLGNHRLIGDVQPCFTNSGAGFKFQVTDAAVNLLSDASKFDEWVDKNYPPVPEFDVFISYATDDGSIADELRSDLENRGLKCFMSGKNIRVASEWQESIRIALIGSKQVLVLLTPRSITRPWVLMEAGAAWVLGKKLIPALAHVTVAELPDLIRRYQASPIETTAQRQLLINELAGT